MSTSGRSSFSCIRMTLDSASGLASGAGLAGSSSFATEYLTIFLSMVIRDIGFLVLSKLAVVALFEGVEEIRGRVRLAVVDDFLVSFGFDDGAVLECEAIGRVLEVLLLHEHALEGLRVEAERRATLEPLLVGVQVDVLEVLVRVVRGHVGG